MSFSSSEHGKLIDSGLLGGSLTSSARAAWPAWAQAHAASCPICQSIFDIDARLRLLSPLVQLPRDRAAHRRPQPLSSFAPSLPRVPAGAWRTAAGPMELERTPTGIHVTAPDSLHLLLFHISHGAAELLLHHQSPRPGVDVECPLAPNLTGQALALATMGQLPPMLTALWVEDLVRAHPLTLPTSPHAHLGRLSLLPPLGGVTPAETLPPPPSHPMLENWLRAARDALAQRRYLDAQDTLQQLVTLADSMQERRTWVEAMLLSAQVATLLGFPEEAEESLQRMAATHALDAETLARLPAALTLPPPPPPVHPAALPAPPEGRYWDTPTLHATIAAAAVGAEASPTTAGARFTSLCWGTPAPLTPSCSLVADGEDLWWTNEQGVAARLPIPLSTLHAWIDLARSEVRRGQTRGAALLQLGQLLFPRGVPTVESLSIASHDVLAGAPLSAMLAALRPGAPLLPLWERTGHFCTPRAKAPLHPGVVSLADPQGDLPYAHQEVTPAQSQRWLRGVDVTLEAFQNLPEMGLLHLGLHAQRQGYLPELVFFDGALDPARIRALRFPSQPIVLLAGCGTGTRRALRGAERSLPEAFLMAGASAVIATRWPVPDDGVSLFVRRLLARWPFRSAAHAVAATCASLQEEGHPASLWSGIVVYR